MTSNDFLQEAQARGFLHQCTDAEALGAALNAGRVGGYIGFDCTADSLPCRQFAADHADAAVAETWPPANPADGAAAPQRSATRPARTSPGRCSPDATIAANMAGIQRSFAAYLQFGDAPGAAMMVNNAAWLDALGYIPLLREVGVHFSINRMLSMDSVKLRLDRETTADFPRIQLHDPCRATISANSTAATA